MTTNIDLGKFTNLYSLQKTLRFELIPVGKDGERLPSEEADKLFESILKEDKAIHDAYVALKPVMDKIHENIINESLISEDAKNIDFSEYFEEYKKGGEKKLNEFEKTLREKIGRIFVKVSNDFARRADRYNDKPIFKKGKDGEDEGTKYLKKKEILTYIEKNIKDLVPPEKVKEFIEEKDITTKSGKVIKEKNGHLAKFSSFYTYFSGYNQNRENYYISKEEKATAVATRIVHDNLPKFCDNCIQFATGKIQWKNKLKKDDSEVPISRKDEYLNVYKFLKDSHKITQIKDVKTNSLIEAYPIDANIFEITKFSDCLSEKGIGEYNKIIGHYNLLLNLYNQTRRDEKEFKKLQPFKTLYKQIGCGEKKSLVHVLIYDTKKQQDAGEKINEILNVEETLKNISEAGKKYFSEASDAHEAGINTIHEFISWLKKNEDWRGVYWSKGAVDKISDKYLINWHDIQDLLIEALQNKKQKKIIKAVASYDIRREEKLKINDAVELSGLFEIIDQKKEVSWSKRFFKESILDERSFIDENLPISRNIVNLLCADIKDLAERFCKESESILEIKDYKDEENILKIKVWLDTAKSLIWLVKYFDVKESKIKGNMLNPELSNLISSILRDDSAKWFDWYDLVRNYLTKKPQDDAKKNKLKLNFRNPQLLGGWSDGQEKNKGTVLLKNKNKYYVGILIKRKIFDTTKKESNLVYRSDNTQIGRMILKSIKFQTVLGKGFGMGDSSYGNMGKNKPLEVVLKAQNYIKEKYVNKHPSLKGISEKAYTNKKTFDRELREALNNCYECDFTPIDWKEILRFVTDNNLYLFEIYTKDFSDKKGDKSRNSNLNLQTKYWESVFQTNSTNQLCGGGELFFREKVELKKDDKAVHPACQKIKRRSDEKIESFFKHPIVKNKRFTTNKYLFHIPVKINYQASTPKPAEINQLVNSIFTQAENIRFLGIDRGERHLIYYSLVDAKGITIEQNHLDVINNKDFLKEINNAAQMRREKQENWQQKGNISNLKDGYISLVIHEIIKKMKDRDGNFIPTFIVLESLNKGFKRGRQKFEQQVYQKFELALAKKLNYYVDKAAKIDEIGSVAKALQLTPPVMNYQDIEHKKQLGTMLYVRPNYTSVTDPETGWRKTIYLKKGSEPDIKKQILNSFTEIGTDNNDYFFQYKDVNGKEWKLWSGKNGKSLERYRAKRGKSKNEWIVQSCAVKEMLDQLFVSFDKKKSLRNQLEDDNKLLKINEHPPWESLRFVIEVIQQIRNSGDKNKNQDDNFLLSPVRNERGEHFDSRTATPQQPKNADANGAYNIARKGIIMYEHIKWLEGAKKKKGTETPDRSSKETSDLDLYISDKEWDLWLYDKIAWKNQLPMFASHELKKKQENKKVSEHK